MPINSLDIVKKAELHCHFDGIADPAMCRKIREGGHDVSIDIERLESVYPVETKDDWINKYIPAVDQLIAQNPGLPLLILDEHIQRLKDQHVVYAELMLSGLGLFATPDVEEMLDIVRRVRERADKSSGDAVQVEFTCAICRGPREDIAYKADRIMSLYEAGLICGFAIACEEDACTIASVSDVFDKLRETGMGIEIHAGEWLGPETVRDALEHGHPNRIGHGVKAFSDPGLVDRLCEEDIHVEFCPTSNLKTGSISKIEDHPVDLARQLGMNFSINTDDPGAFSCSMTSEYDLLRENFRFTEEDFDRILANSLRSAFVTPRPG